MKTQFRTNKTIFKMKNVMPRFLNHVARKGTVAVSALDALQTYLEDKPTCVNDIGNAPSCLHNHNKSPNQVIRDRLNVSYHGLRVAVS